MKFPSLSDLVSKSRNSFLRFPFAILISALGVYFSIKAYNADHWHGKELDYLYEAIMTCSLGLPLFVVLTLLMERRHDKMLMKAGIQLLASGLLVLYYLSIKGHILSEDIVRFFVLCAGFHFFVAFAPFIIKGEVNGFWQYNKTLFLRFILTALYSGVLFAGLSIALLAIKNLLGIHVPDKYFFYLWVSLAGIFNTWFFLAGVPESIDELDLSEEYPKGLKIFTQFVLLPLVTVYLSILYLYIFKIIYHQSLPKGWVSWLVICFSTVGVLSLLLIFPVKDKAGNTWIKIYSKWFYIVLFPLIVLMFDAIITRIKAYGITEDRYYVSLLACWLTFIAIYFTFSKRKNIKLIPITLALCCFVSVYGPWSAASVSIHSQYGRLVAALSKENMIQDHKIIKTSKPLKDSVSTYIMEQINYLEQNHGAKSLQPFFTENLDSINQKTKKEPDYSYSYNYDLQNMIREKYLSELPYIPIDVNDTVEIHKKKNVRFESTKTDKTPDIIKGYDYMMNVDEDLNDFISDYPSVAFTDEKGNQIRYITVFNKDTKNMIFIDADLNKCFIDIGAYVTSKLKAKNKSLIPDNTTYFYYPEDSLIITKETPEMKVALKIKSLDFTVKDDTISLGRISASALTR